MAIWDKLLSPLTGIVEKVIDKVLPVTKASEVERTAAKFEATKFLREALIKEESSFQSFVIEHTGAAKDMPKFIQVFRGIVRPTLTLFAFGSFVYGIWASWPTAQMDMLFKLNLITLGFWFGPKAVQQSGITQAWVARKNGGS